MRSVGFILVVFWGALFSLSCRESGVGVEYPDSVVASLDVGGMEADIQQFDQISGLMSCKNPNQEEKITIPEAIASLTGSQLKLNFKPSKSLNGLQCFVSIVSEASAELSQSYEFMNFLDDGRVTLFLSNYATVNGNEIEVDFLKTFNPLGSSPNSSQIDVKIGLLTKSGEREFEALNLSCQNGDLSFAINVPQVFNDKAAETITARVSSAEKDGLTGCLVKGLSDGVTYETDTINLIADGDGLKADKDYIIKSSPGSGDEANIEVKGKIRDCTNGEIVIASNGSATCEGGIQESNEPVDDTVKQSEEYQKLMKILKEYDVDTSKPIALKGSGKNNKSDRKTIDIMEDEGKIKVVTTSGEFNFDGFGPILKVRERHDYDLYKAYYGIVYNSTDGVETLLAFTFLDNGTIEIDFSATGTLVLELYLLDK